MEVVWVQNQPPIIALSLLGQLTKFIALTTFYSMNGLFKNLKSLLMPITTSLLFTYSWYQPFVRLICLRLPFWFCYSSSQCFTISCLIYGYHLAFWVVFAKFKLKLLVYKGCAEFQKWLIEFVQSLQPGVPSWHWGLKLGTIAVIAGTESGLTLIWLRLNPFFLPVNLICRIWSYYLLTNRSLSGQIMRSVM